jgi:hypothetical protein
MKYVKQAIGILAHREYLIYIMIGILINPDITCVTRDDYSLKKKKIIVW